ncbi:hypothetical protein [Marinobacterium weihaiense]|uniref:Ribbon-helix-helix protein CopG domain-containing protein n=1 Tax=Marinobacterium weihaiense TaxID=2851016 RepID=A0ABS6MCX3_9GAMM|nr:hypothetical protein [Marinobacterium weihaiense]MBV0934149.1 hypothetical protein [Marinobacterium weihaiense]
MKKRRITRAQPASEISNQVGSKAGQKSERKSVMLPSRTVHLLQSTLEEKGMHSRQRSQLINSYMDTLFTSKSLPDIVMLALLDYTDAGQSDAQQIQVIVSADNMAKITDVQRRYSENEFDYLFEPDEEPPLPKDPPAISTLLRIAINDQLFEI